MIRHIFLDKTATIIRDSETNTGLNPVVEANYGDAVTRFLVHFDEKIIKDLVEEKEINLDGEPLAFTLRMTNCTAINGVPYEKKLSYGNTSGDKERASSFNLLAIRLPKPFDEGRGFEFIDDTWVKNKKSFSIKGVNWFQASNGVDWDEPGVYGVEAIAEAYKAFSESGDTSVVLCRQHFDFGDECLEMDITEYVKDVLAGADNNGLMICFTPALETAETEVQQYVGFFTDHTNTFFHPYVELKYDNEIYDDRESLFAGQESKLYLYSYIDGMPENLDELPSFSIDGVNNLAAKVKQVSKGVYCSTFRLDSSIADNTILYDIWDNVKYRGEDVGPIELEAVVQPKARMFSIGSASVKIPHIVPSVFGINNDEKVSQDEVREVVVDFRMKYTTDKRATTNKAFYRLYAKNGNQQINIFNGYQPVEKSFLHNFFLIHTRDLVPGRYYVDIKVLEGREELFYEDVLHFDIVNNVTPKYA